MTIYAVGSGQDRREEAFRRRVEAATLAKNRTHAVHISNGDEYRFRNSETKRPIFITSFTKGLPHGEDGIVKDPADYTEFIKAIDSADPEVLRRIPLGRSPAASPRWRSVLANGSKGSFFTKPVKARGWESAGAGQAFDLEGRDAQSSTMPPVPALMSSELQFEMAELYLMALTRDIPFSAWGTSPQIAKAVQTLNRMPWVTNRANVQDPVVRARLRGPFNVNTIFRGIGDDVYEGPYLSQFLLRGNRRQGSTTADGTERDGYIQYGSIRIDQRVRVAASKVDWVTTWESFLDVQDGADVRGADRYDYNVPFRFMYTPRDLTTYVHLDDKVPFDQGLPFQLDDEVDKQQGFAHFGGPHILSLVCEVATRALKAVRYQKFNVHRRGRPEAIGGLIHRQKTVGDIPAAKELVQELEGILADVVVHNREQNTRNEDRKGDASASRDIFLLPIAFPEGSPMHPSYGSGHATVAGACVTILKAFFDTDYPLDKSYIATNDGKSLQEVQGLTLTVGGELNKLASNISVGRNWAGVHYFTDYMESVKLGEEIAISLLQEQKLTFNEVHSMTLRKFDGSTIRI